MLFHPKFDWIQVEITSHCNCSCVYCPSTVFEDTWMERHMTLDTFNRLTPALRKTKLIHLQGWGEPFLHPEPFTFVRIAKKSGCKVGTTTNGTMIDNVTAERIVNSGIDFIAISCAGTGKRNDSLRKGVLFEDIAEVIRRLNRAKKKLDSKKPAIHLAFTMLNSESEHAHELPLLVSKLGVNQIIISTLDLVPTENFFHESAALANPENLQKISNAVNRTISNGHRYGIPVFCHLPGQNQGECIENIERSLFISADGEVSPCVFYNIPASKVCYYAGGKQHDYKRLTFGNMNNNELAQIWKNQEYLDFRKSVNSDNPPYFCTECPKRRTA